MNAPSSRVQVSEVLASVFPGLKHPEVFGSVISQSGSFFWKPDGAQQEEWLIHQLQAAPKLRVRFYVEVGLMESDSMEIGPNRRMRDALIAKGDQTKDQLSQYLADAFSARANSKYLRLVKCRRSDSPAVHQLASDVSVSLERIPLRRG